MASKGALLCFQFRNIEDIYHDPNLEYDFTKEAPIAGEAIQPIVAEAVARIKRSIAASLTPWFNFGRTITTNLSNFLHVSTLTFNTEIEHNDGSRGQTSYVNVMKFYHMGANDNKDNDCYRVSLDIEAMHSSAIGAHETGAFEMGMTEEQVGLLADLLGQEFEILGRVEVLGIFKRGSLSSNKCPDESGASGEAVSGSPRRHEPPPEPDRQSP